MSIFSHTSIYINGDVKNKQQLTKLIKENGGTIAFMIGKTVTHLITTNDDFQTQNSNIKKAISYNINIVSEQWVHDSISNQNVSDVSKYQFTLAPPTPTTPTTPTKVISPLTSYNSNNNNNEEISTTGQSATAKYTTVKRITKPAAAVAKAIPSTVEISSQFQQMSINPPSGVTLVPTTQATNPNNLPLVKALTSAQVGKLYSHGSPDEPAFPPTYIIEVEKTLQCSVIDGDNSNNKFYHLELHRTHIPGISRVFTRYGRTDGKVTTETRYYTDFSSSKSQFEKTLAEKTSASKGYEEVFLISSKMSSRPAPVNAVLIKPKTVSANPAVEQLVTSIFNEATKHLTTTCAVTITERGVETPLGVLSTQQVEKGENILEKIGEEIKKPIQNRATLESLSSKFYTAIPYKLGRGSTVSQHVITNGNQVNDKFELLQLMKDLIKIGSDGSLSQSSFSMKYAALKNYIDVLSPDSTEYKNLLRNEFKNLPANIHIEKIYQLEKTSESMSFSSIRPTKLLLHGSRYANFVGILSRGMLLPKVIVATGGARSDFGFLGAGIYFADQFDRSFQYAHPSVEDKSTRLMLVSEVAIGKTKSYTKIDSTLTKAPTGFDSCLGVAKTATNGSDFNDNEYVIYKAEQQKQRYLVQFNTNHGVAKPATTATSSVSYSTPQVEIEKPKQTVTTFSVPKAQSNINNNNNNNSFKSYTQSIQTGENHIPRNYNKKEEEEKETSLRKLFATSRNDSKLSDPFVNTISVFGNSDFNVPSEPFSPVIMPFEHVKLYQNSEFIDKSKVHSSYDEFKSKWDEFSNQMFNGFNWNNVFVAGGSVLGCSLANPKGFEESDIDIFLYDLTEQAATEKLKEIFRFIKTKCPNTTVARTKYAVTFLNESPFRNIQVVLRIYKSPAEVLMGFDIDCCSIGFTGKNVVTIPRARDAIVYGVNRVCMSRRSTTYENRLFKYAKRGFAIYVPNFDRKTVPTSVYSNISDLKAVSGLHKLLLLEFGFITGDSKILDSKESDYSEVDMPWGKYWRTYKMASYLIYKDKSQFFANKAVQKHRHIVLVGENDSFNGKAAWCRKCSSGEPLTNEEGYVSGTIKWVTQDPGRQLLTGSFHPVSDGEWYNISSSDSRINKYKQDILDNKVLSITETFKPALFKKTNVSQNPCNFILNSNHLVAIAAALGKPTSLRSLVTSPQYKPFINTPCSAGFYPVHYAILSGNTECLKILIENGAYAILKSQGLFRIPPRILATVYRRFELLNTLPYQRIRRMLNRSLADFRPIYPSNYNSSSLVNDPLHVIIKTGNVSVLKNALANAPPTAPVADEIGQTLLHIAVLSPNPKEQFDLINAKYPQLIKEVNIFGQSVYQYALMALSTIHSWNNSTRSPLITPEERIQYQYIVEQSSRTHSLTTNIPMSPLPTKFHMAQVQEQEKLAINEPKTIFGASKITPPIPTFGQGGKFPAKVQPQSGFGSSQPSFSFGTPPTQSNTGFSFGKAQAQPITNGGFGSGGFVPTQPGFGSTASNTGFSFGKAQAQPSFSFGIPPTPAFVQSPPITPSFGTTFNSTNMAQLPTGTVQTSNLKLPALNHEFAYSLDPRFLSSSLVAKCLTILSTTKPSSTLQSYEEDKVRELIQKCYMPVINSFEAFLIHANPKSLFEDLKCALKIHSEN